MARKKKVPGWHGMKKDELVKALLRHARIGAGRRSRATVKIILTASPTTNCPNAWSKSRRNSPQAKDLTFRTVADEAGQAKTGTAWW